MPKRSSIGRLDLNQLAKQVVDEATRDSPSNLGQPDKNPAAVALGRLGGLKGGVARAAKLSPTMRSEIARNAAEKRWGKTKIKQG
ncbi:hypothetical protein G6550_08430 [Azonexus fungiphilus]|nr:hypothetical protein [Azonexus fungiphilus]